MNNNNGQMMSIVGGELDQQQQLSMNPANLQQQLLASEIRNTSIVHQQHVVDTTLTFTENLKFKELSDHLKKMRDQEKFCDVALYVHGREFPAHKIVLSSCSQYFDSIFSPKSKEKLLKLSISCQEPDIFSVFMNYIYTGVVSINKENVGELMRLSNNFHVLKLKKYCAEFLERFIEPENALHIKDVGDKFNIPNLSKNATIYIQNNLADVINHEIMMELPLKQIENFVTEKAWSSTIPQDAIVKLMSRWVCHDLSREKDLKTLLTNIDWCSMDPNVIIDYIDQEPLYGTSERCFYYVLNSLADKGIQVQKYEQIYQALQQRFAQESDQPLGFGDNLLQMAFNSAMEGLDSSLLLSDNRENKWPNENEHSILSSKLKSSKSKPSLKIEQIRRRALKRIQRNRSIKKLVYVRLDRPNKKKLKSNEEIAESSGDEECDPIQINGFYKCHLCPLTTKKVSRLERHLASVHAHDCTFRCSICSFTCKWNRDYFLHMKSHFDGPPYNCQFPNCSFTCQKIGSLMAHRVSHMDLKPYHCSECDYKCKNKTTLAIHVKTHNNEKPYRCTICGRSFASKNSLDQHSAGHNTDKIYSCALCPFSTKYLNHFTTHKKSHANSNNNTSSTTTTTAPKKSKKEQYRCQDSQCKYTTSKKSQLDSHMRSHAGVRPHICSICGRRFLEKSHLVRHERIHYNERPFKCEECDYASTRRDKLKEHKSRHHGINASAKSPYKPRPHKNNKNNANFDGQSIVYAKKSSVSAAHQNQQQQQQQQQNQHVSQSVSTSTNSGVISSGHQQQQQLQLQDTSQQQTQQVTTSQELEFIIPHGHNAAYVQALQSGGIDLQQIANSSGIVLRTQPFQQGGNKQDNIRHISSEELQRTLGVNLEDLIDGIKTQPGGRTIKLEELTRNTQGMGAPTRIHHQQQQHQQHHGSTSTTMVLDSVQLQQLTSAASNDSSITLGNSHHQTSNGDENSLTDTNNQTDFSNLLY